MRARVGVAVLALVWVLLPAEAAPQDATESMGAGSYSSQYGPPQLVELRDLANSGETYHRRNVRT